MIYVLGDLLADLSLRVPSFPIAAGQMQHVQYFELGPGGAANVAIAAARLGLQVGCLGELGSDRVGNIVIEILHGEGIDVSGIVRTPGADTPVAGVLVDARGEPAYLGYPGTLQVRELLPEWRQRLPQAEALFVDGWAGSGREARIVLEGLRTAHDAGVPTFFDPGPGNPAIDNDWHHQAAALSTALLLTESEAQRLTQEADPLASARELSELGPELVVVKRGVAGCMLLRRDELRLAPGFPVEARDATGAGDSLDAAVIFACLRRMALPEMGILANAVGAAKVEKLGTGRNVPTRQEVAALLKRFHLDPDLLAR
jgi:sugar/nucleoside kinase (ribokinase family)